MWRLPWLLLLLLLLCGAQESHQGAVTTPPPSGARPSPAGAAAVEAVGVTREAGTQSPQGSPAHGAPTAAPPEEEPEQQGSIISQLLGDYDKVKTVSSGSDCVCRCIVRPMRRADCSHMHDGGEQAPVQDFYTVETVTKGSDCRKCVCTAPPSAVNPCEGEYRLKKLQEASKDDIKLATIIDLLEGSLYGMDLLKLQSVTTKLLTRVDNMEKALARNFTERAREKERLKEKAKEKEKKTQQKKKKVNDLEGPVQKSRAAASADKQKKYDAQLKLNPQRDGLEEPTRNKTAAQKPVEDKMRPKTPVKEKSGVVIRGVTFYKAEEESDVEEEEDANVKRKEKTAVPPSQPPATKDPTQRGHEPTQRSTAAPSTIQETTAATTSSPATTKPTSTAVAIAEETTAAPTAATSPSPSATQPRTTIPPTSNQRTTLPSETNIGAPTDGPLSGKSVPLPRSRLSWTERPEDQAKTTKRPGVCKDTLASISEPVQQNFYGLRDGAWMRDARGHGSVIYLTNGHYGSNLQEFRDLQTFKSGQPSNSYKLPYSFTGTGHVVYNGAFFYNRAFSRDIIRYDLRHRYVAAWTTLHDSLLEEQAHHPQSEVQFAVDESGLWVLYPALDTEGFHQEVILLIQVSPRDLQPIQSFRTGLRRGLYGNSFLVCGVLYAVDSMERHYANVTYAFDTHTLTHTMPSLAFVNMHTHTSQLAYCPLDKKLYAWDNGHQMTHDVVFAY